MTSLFDDINQFDEGFRVAKRQAVAVAHKRVQDTVGSYLRLSKTAEERAARLDYVSDDIRQIVADTADEYSVDHDKLLDAIHESLEGEGVTDINGELADAPSAVGEKTSGGHKPDCGCGFCKNKGNLPGSKKDGGEEKVEGIVDDEEKADKDASEPDFKDKFEDKESKVANDFAFPPGADNGMSGGMGGAEIYVRTGGGNLLGPFNNEQEALQAKDAEEADELQRHGDPNQNPGEMPEGWDPRQGSARVADAPRDGGGATKTVDLPKGKGDAVGYGASPEIDKKEWKPNALNSDGNLPAVPEGIEMDGTPNPTQQQDLVDDKPDYEGDFLRDTDAATTSQDLPTAGDNANTTEKNISQEGQMGSWTESQGSPVTDKVFASFATVESAVKKFTDGNKE
jgi:hypothetical protein